MSKFISQSDVKTHYGVTDKNNNVSSEGLAVILAIMSVSTFKIAVILYILVKSPLKTVHLLIRTLHCRRDDLIRGGLLYFLFLTLTSSIISIDCFHANINVELYAKLRIRCTTLEVRILPGTDFIRFSPAFSSM